MPNVYLMPEIDQKTMAKLKDILKKHNVSIWLINNVVDLASISRLDHL